MEPGHQGQAFPKGWREVTWVAPAIPKGLGEPLVGDSNSPHLGPEGVALVDPQVISQRQIDNLSLRPHGAQITLAPLSSLTQWA